MGVPHDWTRSTLVLVLSRDGIRGARRTLAVMRHGIEDGGM